MTNAMTKSSFAPSTSKVPSACHFVDRIMGTCLVVPIFLFIIRLGVIFPYGAVRLCS